MTGATASRSRRGLVHDPGSESDSESDRDSLPLPAARRPGHQLDDNDSIESDASGASGGQGGDSDSEVDSEQRSCDEAPGAPT